MRKILHTEIYFLRSDRSVKINFRRLKKLIDENKINELTSADEFLKLLQTPLSEEDAISLSKQFLSFSENKEYQEQTKKFDCLANDGLEDK